MSDNGLRRPRSTRLREWARRNKNSKYIPEPLLEAWGFEIESTL